MAAFSISPRYSEAVQVSTPLPNIWLLSDQRNDAGLEQALERLPQRSGFVFRHYHLGPSERRKRFEVLNSRAKAHGHIALLSGTVELARAWGAEGTYGPPDQCIHDCDMLQLATAHNEAEIALAHRNRADALFLSPVFPTQSHPKADTLGIDGFHRLAALSDIPVIALGGMTAERARQLNWPRWSAIDGLA